MILSIMALIALSANYSTFAGATGQSTSRVIEGSYVITFKGVKDGAAQLIQPPNPANRGKTPFGESTTGQSKTELATTLGIAGKVVAIFETISAAHIQMDAKEAERLSKDSRVLLVEQNVTAVAQTTQTNPGWGLDRLDSPTPALDNAYSYSNTGAGQTIFIMDSGLNLSNPAVAAEFGGRASVVYDVNGGTGNDCLGHGSYVASAAGGNTNGVAKGATLLMAKVTTGCTDSIPGDTAINVFNWLAANAPKGTIVNYSFGYITGNCSVPYLVQALENAVTAAHNAGIIVVVAAGNDGCNTANYSPANIPQAFVVGATGSHRLPGVDAKWYLSRTGWNISTFSPGKDVQVMNQNGAQITVSGTSISAPYMAGMFAVACQAISPYCSSGNTAAIYTAMRNSGTLNTVTNNDGTPLTGATSRFIRQQW